MSWGETFWGESWGGESSGKSLAEQVKERLPDQFKLATKIQDLVSIIGERADIITGVTSDVGLYCGLLTAFGAQLDRLGEIVDEARNSRSDSEYRAAMLGKIQILISDGTPQDIQNVALGLWPGLTLAYKEYYPAAFVVRVYGAELETHRVNATTVTSTRPAAVDGVVEYYPVINRFTLDIGPGLCELGGTETGTFSDAWR